jgi:hypothetical protein
MAQMLKAMLKIRGSKVRLLQLIQFLDCIQNMSWVSRGGMVDLNTWQKVGERLHGCYMAKGLDGMTILTFGLWSQIRDCLDSTPSSVSEPGDEVSFSMVRWKPDSIKWDGLYYLFNCSIPRR